MKVWGDQWKTSLDHLTSTMFLPSPTTLGPRYRVYGHPRWVKGVTHRLPDRATLEAVNVPSEQFVELRVVFPRSLLTSTTGAQEVDGPGLGKIVHEEIADEQSYKDNQAQIDDAKHHWLRTAGYLLLIGLVPALLVIGVIWLIYGRERKVDYDREYEQAPPTDTPPALVPPLLRQTHEAGSFEFTATLFDLIRRGYYKSTPVTTEHDAWGGLKKEQVADLELSNGDQSIDLQPWENSVAAVFNGVLASGPERLSNMRDRIKADRTENAERFTAFKNRVGTAIRAKKWYVGTGAWTMWIVIVALHRRRGDPDRDPGCPLAQQPASLDGHRPARDRHLHDRQLGRALLRVPPRQALEAAYEVGRARGRALAGLPPLPDRLPPTAGRAAGDVAALGAVPRLRDRLRDRGARAPGCPAADAAGASRPERGSTGSRRTATSARARARWPSATCPRASARRSRRPARAGPAAGSPAAEAAEEVAAGVASARRLVLAAALVATLSWTATATAEYKDYLLGPAQIAVQVDPDGSLDVRETIGFSFIGHFTGAYRDIPLRKGESIDRIAVSDTAPAEPVTVYKPGGSAELGSSGDPGTFGVARLKDRARIVWHFDSNRCGRSRSPTASAAWRPPTTTSWT